MANDLDKFLAKTSPLLFVLQRGTRVAVGMDQELEHFLGDEAAKRLRDRIVAAWDEEMQKAKADGKGVLLLHRPEDC